MTEQIRTPFTPAQVESLNEYQVSGVFHPFTCGRCRDAEMETMGDELKSLEDEHLLIATPEGWCCPTCDRQQDWAWEWMANFGWQRLRSAT